LPFKPVSTTSRSSPPHANSTAATSDADPTTSLRGRLIATNGPGYKGSPALDRRRRLAITIDQTLRRADMHEKGTTATRILGAVILSSYALFLVYAVLAMSGVRFVSY
jgi:hypothetical protein